jgi:hypothetical protein
VESMLKRGLDKVKPAEEVEAKAVVHENIRGGAYFDREELDAASAAGEIEARCWDEERFSIMNEPRADTADEGPCDSRWEEVKTGNTTEEIEARYWQGDGFRSMDEAGADPGCTMNVVSDAWPPARDTGATPASWSLPELIEQLRAAWERPRTARRGGRREDRGGGDDSRPCTEGSACVALPGSGGQPEVGREESGQRACGMDEAMCEADEDRRVGVTNMLRRGEVK